MPTFDDVINDAIRDKIVYDCKQLKAGVYSGKVNDRFGSVAMCRRFAGVLPGMGFPNQQTGGCSWRVGSKTIGVLIHPSTLPSVYEAQGIAEPILQEGYEEKWSLGGIARTLLRWVQPGKQDETYTPDHERLIRNIPYGYHECSPGVYPLVDAFDVSAYYYSMLKRLPSLRCYVGPKTLQFLPTPQDQWNRWQVLLREVERHKGLRNQIAGNMAGATLNSEGGRQLRVWYSKTKQEVRVAPIPYAAGRMRGVGLLLVRSGAELTCMQCHRVGAGAVYSNSDCCFTRGEECTLWQEYGFRVRHVGQGDAEICHRGSYRIGEDGKETYKKGQREYIPVDRMAIPEVLYAPQWL